VGKARSNLYFFFAVRADDCFIDCFCWHDVPLLLGGVVQRIWCLGQKSSSSVLIVMTYLLPLLTINSLELALVACELFFCQKNRRLVLRAYSPFVVRPSLQVLLYLSSVIFPALFPLREGGEEGKRGGSGLCVLLFFWLSTGSYAVFSPLGRDSS